MPITSSKEPLFEYKDEPKLDKKDRRILFELHNNARVSISSISRVVALSKDTVKYRIKRMEKVGLLQGYTAVVCFNRLGYHWNILLLQTKFENKRSEEKFISFLQSSENVLKVMKCSGKWDYQIDVLRLSLLEFNEFIRELKNLVLLLDFSVLNCLQEIKYSHIPPAFFSELDKREIHPPVGRVDESKKKLEFGIEFDETDLQIVKYLVENSRMSLSSLSRRIGLSPDSTNKRIKRLEKNGLLFGFMPVINTALLSNEHWIFMQLNSFPPKLVSYLKEHENVQAIYEVGYQYDLFFWISTKTIGKYEQVLGEIKNKFSSEIMRLDSVLALREYKYSEFPNTKIKPPSV